MKINGFEYTEQEVLEALRSKGYLILVYVSEEIGRTPIKCAVKGDELPCEKNMWQNVALKVFQRTFVKPKLV